ncbi:MULTISPECIES: TetR/AcrR family transcriptional regulator [unclassified Streptomyces]|uniref:TetR/AcrR family transcriptional regulator n=1 Tax=unclassified Streptomyces TaxID=2593676 RepID=UPI003723F4A5
MTATGIKPVPSPPADARNSPDRRRRPSRERADATRNREQLLRTIRSMIEHDGAEKVTMETLAEQAGVGKGTVFRRFGTRAGIFQALLTEEESRFEKEVESGPPPLGPGADPVQRLVAYGRARIEFLLAHKAIVRESIEHCRPTPQGGLTMTLPHIRALLGQTGTPWSVTDLDCLAMQLTAALEGPLLLHLEAESVPAPGSNSHALAASWQWLIERLLRD